MRNLILSITDSYDVINFYIVLERGGKYYLFCLRKGEVNNGNLLLNAINMYHEIGRLGKSEEDVKIWLLNNKYKKIRTFCYECDKDK